MSESVEVRIRNAIRTKTQVAVAHDADMDKTAMNRIVKGERGVMLHELEGFLAALDMAVIECKGGETTTIPRAKYDALRIIARDGLLVE